MQTEKHQQDEDANKTQQEANASPPKQHHASPKKHRKKKKHHHKSPSKKHKHQDFDLQGLHHVAIPQYNSLLDKNLQEYFLNPKVRQALFDNCIVDKKTGRVLIDIAPSPQMRTLEQEFELIYRKKLGLDWTEECM